MQMAETRLKTVKGTGLLRGAATRFMLSDPRNKPSRSQVPMGDKIRKAARGQHCRLRLAGCNNNPETTVFAHAPSIDNGMGLKQAPDFWGAFACSNCHDVVDGRVTSSEQRIMILERWLAGVYETQKALIAMGLLKYDDT